MGNFFTLCLFGYGFLSVAGDKTARKPGCCHIIKTIVPVNHWFFGALVRFTGMQIPDAILAKPDPDNFCVEEPWHESSGMHSF